MNIRLAERPLPSGPARVAPTTVVWEVTRACVWPIAGGPTGRDPMELSTEEGGALIGRLTEFGSPVLELTGGDPTMRRDLCELVERAEQRGLSCVVAPTSAPLPSTSLLRELREAGLRRLALCLDAPAPAPHNACTTAGSWERTVMLLERARATGLSTQIRTTLTRHNVGLLPEMVGFVRWLDPAAWRLQFLVPEGRGHAPAMLSPRQHEEVLHWLRDLSVTEEMEVEVAAAPMLRRVQAQHGYGYASQPLRSADDRWSLFVSHDGNIMPWRFPPLVTGNVRRDDVVDVFRRHIIFRRLREARYLKGKCGVCEFQKICGGQRARAHAVTGDPLAADPACAYVPSGYRKDPEP